MWNKHCKNVPNTFRIQGIACCLNNPLRTSLRSSFRLKYFCSKYMPISLLTLPCMGHPAMMQSQLIIPPYFHLSYLTKVDSHKEEKDNRKCNFSERDNTASLGLHQTFSFIESIFWGGPQLLRKKSFS